MTIKPPRLNRLTWSMIVLRCLSGVVSLTTLLISIVSFGTVLVWIFLVVGYLFHPGGTYTGGVHIPLLLLWFIASPFLFVLHGAVAIGSKARGITRWLWLGTILYLIGPWMLAGHLYHINEPSRLLFWVNVSFTLLVALGVVLSHRRATEIISHRTL